MIVCQLGLVRVMQSGQQRLIMTPNRFARPPGMITGLCKSRHRNSQISLIQGSGGRVPAPQRLNAFNDEPNARFAISGHRPPKIAFRLVTGFRKSRYDTFDRVDGFSPCRIGIRNGSPLDHIIVLIERKFYNLKGQNRAPLGSGLQTPFAASTASKLTPRQEMDAIKTDYPCFHPELSKSNLLERAGDYFMQFVIHSCDHAIPLGTRVGAKRV